MNCFIFVKDLFSFVFLRNSNTEVCDSLKGETAEKIRVIDWRRASWNGVDWPSMAVHKQLQNERNEKKEKSLLDVLNHFTLQPAKRLDGGAWSDWVPGRNVLTEHALDRRHLETCTQRPSHMLFKNSSVKAAGRKFLNWTTKPIFCDGVQFKWIVTGFSNVFDHVWIWKTCWVLKPIVQIENYHCHSFLYFAK